MNKNHRVTVKSLNYEIVVSEFELQSRYYVHFRTNTIGKGMNPFGLNNTIIFLLEGWIWY